MMEDDHKWDDLFNSQFEDKEFERDEEKREYARQIFNELMNSMEEKFGNLDELDNLDKYKNVVTGIFPSMEKINKMIKDHNLEVSTLEITRLKTEFVVVERWVSQESDHVLDQKYILTNRTFDDKDLSIKHRIIEELIDNNLLGDNEQEKFLNKLPKKDQKKYYNILLDQSIEIENYEEASVLRDKIKKL